MVISDEERIRRRRQRKSSCLEMGGHGSDGENLGREQEMGSRVQRSGQRENLQAAAATSTMASAKLEEAM